HLSTVRYLGHAGTDLQSAYRSPASMAHDLERDPLLALARRIGTDDLAQRYDAIARTVRQIADEYVGRPTLASARAVMAPLAPRETHVSFTQATPEARL